jgi:hypothetical protein
LTLRQAPFTTPARLRGLPSSSEEGKFRALVAEPCFKQESTIQTQNHTMGGTGADVLPSCF